jgi:hypothetical protein
MPIPIGELLTRAFSPCPSFITTLVTSVIVLESVAPYFVLTTVLVTSANVEVIVWVVSAKVVVRVIRGNVVVTVVVIRGNVAVVVSIVVEVAVVVEVVVVVVTLGPILTK